MAVIEGVTQVQWDQLDKKVRYLIVLRGQGVRTDVLNRAGPLKVWLEQPGKHFKTHPMPGGDFKVWLQSARTGNKKRGVTFTDLFEDAAAKREWADATGEDARAVLRAIHHAMWRIVLDGADPKEAEVELRRFVGRTATRLIGQAPGYELPLLLTALQCLALAEYRRYQAHETEGGGRYLMPRAISGVLYGNWTPDEARPVTKTTDRVSGRLGGRPALEELEARYGRPPGGWEPANIGA